MDDTEEMKSGDELDHRAKSKEFSAIVVLGCVFSGVTLLLVAGIFKLVSKVLM